MFSWVAKVLQDRVAMEQLSVVAGTEVGMDSVVAPPVEEHPIFE
jgi:hypothetical protein